MLAHWYNGVLRLPNVCPASHRRPGVAAVSAHPACDERYPHSIGVEARRGVAGRLRISWDFAAGPLGKPDADVHSLHMMISRSALLALVVSTVLVPVSAMGMASAELYGTTAYTYGRFDARIQFPLGDGVVGAFFLWKEGSEVAGAYWNELDYETLAADCHMQLNNTYGNPKKQHQTTPALGFAICGGYHDYRIEWTPTYIAWVVDDNEVRRDTGADATAYADNASGGMTIHFNIWPGNAGFGGNINNTTLPVHQYISWVEYSSYDNGNFAVQWREEFQSSGVPSGWATGNWASPYNLSTHNPQNVAFVNGIAVLSLTADDATGDPGTPPADPNASTGGTTSTGGTSSTTSSGGTIASGGTTGSDGTTAVGGSGAEGGTTASGGSTATGGDATSGTAGPTAPDGGCSCRAAPAANPPWLVLMALSLAVPFLRPARRSRCRRVRRLRVGQTSRG